MSRRPEENKPACAEREWVVEIDDDKMVAQLRSALNAFVYEQSGSDKLSNRLYVLVDQFQGLRVEVFSREHPPPHFRVSCQGQTANYRISDCAQLNGDLARYHSVVRDWHAQNKNKLIDTWNSRRPSDCPVGRYQEG